jgi:hypothetical protein
MKKKTDKVEKIRQMMNIEILGVHSTLGPGSWTLPVERLKRASKLIQGSQFFLWINKINTEGKNLK